MAYIHFKDLQNMAFKMVNNLSLFMSAQISRNLLHEWMIGIEEPPYRVHFYCAKNLVLRAIISCLYC